LKGVNVAKERTTADKRNAYSIRCFVSQAIFKEFIVAQGDECFKYTKFPLFDRPELSVLAGIATKAIMKDPRLNVVLRKE